MLAISSYSKKENKVKESGLDKANVGIDVQPGDDEVVWGAEDIGRVINRSKRQTVHLLENGRLPAKKVGRLWAANRGRLRRHFNEEVA